MTISPTLCDLGVGGQEREEICMEPKEGTINLSVAFPKTCHVKGRHRLTRLRGRNNTFQLFPGRKDFALMLVQFHCITAATGSGQRQ